MTLSERILQILISSTDLYCDDCLSKVLKITPGQSINQTCNRLMSEGKIHRYKGECFRCGGIKLVNLVKNGIIKNRDSVSDSQEVIQENASHSTNNSWYWEGNIQSKIVDYLTQSGYLIQNIADTKAKTPGKDIIARSPNGRPLWMSVKGFPEGTKSTNSSTQARHWFSIAIFDVIIYRSESTEVDLAIGFPSGKVTYINLLKKVSWLKENLPFIVYWVDESGNVTIE